MSKLLYLICVDYSAVEFMVGRHLLSLFFCYLSWHVLKKATPFEGLYLIQVQIFSAAEIHSAFLQVSQDIFAFTLWCRLTFKLQRLPQFRKPNFIKKCCSCYSFKSA